VDVDLDSPTPGLSFFDTRYRCEGKASRFALTKGPGLGTSFFHLNKKGRHENNLMASNRKTVIVTGASQGIGAGVVKAFLARYYDVVGTARSATKSKELSASEHLALIDGDIGQYETAEKVAELAIKRFGSIDAVVANAGLFLVKPFTEYTADDFRALVSTNLAGFIYITQLAVKQMQAQKAGGSIVSISAALVDNPIAGQPASLSMITKGGLNAAIRSLAMEYAKEHIRFNAVAPGAVDSPLHAEDSEDSLKTLSPMGTISSVEEIASAVVYLTEARQITGEVLHVDGGAHIGKW
jgi:NAD(P)-dependent dehydrogenase (short-subunit alcohol dehydrogenase family)